MRLKMLKIAFSEDYNFEILGSRYGCICFLFLNNWLHYNIVLLYSFFVYYFISLEFFLKVQT